MFFHSHLYSFKTLVVYNILLDNIILHCQRKFKSNFKNFKKSDLVEGGEQRRGDVLKGRDAVAEELLLRTVRDERHRIPGVLPFADRLDVPVVGRHHHRDARRLRPPDERREEPVV